MPQCCEGEFSGGVPGDASGSRQQFVKAVIDVCANHQKDDEIDVNTLESEDIAE
jgi:hypothetical protein